MHSVNQGGTMKQKQRIYELKNPKLDNYNVVLNEVLFHNANGYIGVRYDFEEGYPEGYSYLRSQYINGFYDFADVPQPELLYGLVREKQIMMNIANTQTIDLMIEDEHFNMFTGTILDFKLTLDMNKGTTVRDVTWRSPKGREIHVKITRMASFHQLTLFTIEYEFEPLNFSGNISIKSGHDVDVKNFYDNSDPRTSDKPIDSIVPITCAIYNEASFISAQTSRSNLTVCSGVKNILSNNWEREFSVSNNAATCIFRTEVTKNKKEKLVKYAVFCDSIRHGNPNAKVHAELDKALAIPLSVFYTKQKEYLNEYWRNCYIEIDGDSEVDTALQYNMYQLIQSVGKDKYGNIAPKGLSGEGYEGQFFWDSEMYIQKYFTITNPEISKNLISFRYETLNYARENAIMLGHKKGAIYPWRTIMGKECSGFFPAGQAQYHINGDIAYSIISYYLATRDYKLIREQGAEIIFETARLWLDVGNYYQDKFHINGVTGPDEYTCMVNNNYYTNVLAKYHLQWAVKIYNMLKEKGDIGNLARRINIEESEIDEFQMAADNMYLPYDKELGINPQDDSFLQKKKWDSEVSLNNKIPLLLSYHPMHLYRYQVCKQADTVMAHFILEDEATDDVILNSYNYYEKITTHDSSLSRCIFSIMAARLGMKEKAVNYLGESIKLDLLDLHNNTKDGVHTANMAGNYMAIVYGFAGFRLKDGGICFAPISHTNWESYRFKVKYEDSRIMVNIGKRDCDFTLEYGTPKAIKVYGEGYLLENKLRISIKEDYNKCGC